MNIQLDDQTLKRLSIVAARQNTSVEDLAAQWLRQASRRDAEKTEDMARLDNMRTNGGIAHNDMMSWLDDLATGKTA